MTGETKPAPKRITNYYEVNWRRSYDPPRTWWKRQPAPPSLRSLPPKTVRAVSANLTKPATKTPEQTP